MAHQVGAGSPGRRALGPRTGDTLPEDVKEYLQEEARLLPSRYRDRELSWTASIRCATTWSGCARSRARKRWARPDAGSAMIRPSQALRLIHINLVLLRHGLDEVILATHLFRPLRFLLYLSPWYWFARRAPP